MSEVVERVARALCLVHVRKHDIGRAYSDAERAKIVDQSWLEFEIAARAAIEAMRDPTDDMRRAGWHVLREKNDFQTRLGNSLVGTETPIFSAMIDAALQSS